MSLNRRDFIRASAGTVLASTLAMPSIVRAQSGTIVVANLLDATGPLNSYSQKQIKATAMAIGELNAAGGLLGNKIELKFYDTQSNNQLYSQYVTQALVRDKAKVVIGGITSSSREVMRPIIHRFKGLLVYNALYEGGVCDARFMCAGLTPAQQVQPLVDYIVNEKGAKRGYILAADYNYGQITSKWMQKYIRQQGGEDLAVEFFPLDVTNFAPVISRIQQAKPDVVWSALVGDAHMSFYKQFQSTIGKQNMMVASSSYGVGRENVALTPNENDGIVIATSFFDTLDKPSTRDFVERFKKFSGENDYISEYGEYGYRGTMLWAEAVKKAGSAEPDAVAAALGGVSYQGAAGLYSVDPQTHHTTMDVHIASGNRAGGFDLVKSFTQIPSNDTRAVCDLIKNPDDTKQYEPQL